MNKLTPEQKAILDAPSSFTEAELIAKMAELEAHLKSKGCVLLDEPEPQPNPRFQWRDFPPNSRN